MSTMTYKCPCCGASLAYGTASGKLDCASCGNSYELDALEAMQTSDEQSSLQFDLPSEGFSAEETREMQGYICKTCGAELMTEGTTTATECPYCGSPTILPENIEGGVKPEKVIPFTVSKEDAQKMFHDYFKGKFLLPNIFRNSRNRISEMRRLYVPYWLFDCEADASISYDARKVRVDRRGDYEITRTAYYAVRRSGSMAFENIPVDGSEKLDNRITESLEPYDLKAAVPFQPAVLAGALADHADVDADACEGRAVERVENSISNALRDTVTGYSSVTEKSRSIHAEGGRITPVLMPVWLITTEKEGKTYTFAINGQTGKLTCNVPTAVGKAFGLGAGVFGGIFGIAALVMYFLEKLTGSAALIAAIVALIAAILVVGGFKAQLKQAVYQSAAEDYIKPGSFHLRVKSDHFLYERESRRKIETNKDKH